MNYTEEIARELLSQPEGEKLEFKTNLRNESVLCRVIVAFANTNGGTVVIGYSKDEERVIEISDDTLSIVLSVCHSDAYAKLCTVNEIEIEGKHILIIDVEKSSELLFFNGLAYVRNGEQIKSLGAQDIRNYYTDNILSNSSSTDTVNKELYLKIVDTLAEITEQNKELNAKYTESVDKYNKDQKRNSRINWLYFIIGVIISISLSSLFVDKVQSLIDQILLIIQGV